MPHARRRHYDVTNTIHIARPRVVLAAVTAILRTRFPRTDLAPLHRAMQLFERLYAGTLPGYLGCDTWYHDAQHSLDCALTLARLIDGHERSVPRHERLGARRAVLGVVLALFHDAGYIRRDSDAARNGAEHTLTHVRRSADFLRRFLPQIGLPRERERAAALVHFTGYEIAIETIACQDPRDYRLGALLGTADILAQCADCCYLEKCRDFLFREFAICGLAGPRRRGQPAPLYRSPQDLLRKTVTYHRDLRAERLDAQFGRAYRYLEVHFDGRNPYLDAIDQHLHRLRRLARERRLGELRRRPVAIDRARLRYAA